MTVDNLNNQNGQMNNANVNPPAPPSPSQPPTTAPSASMPTQSAPPQPNAGLSPENKEKIIAVRAAKLEKKKSLTWLILMLLAVIVLISGFGVFLLSQGNQETNPLLKMLGIQAFDRQRILLILSNIVFGTLIFLSFLVSIVNLFRAGFTKDDVAKKKKSMIYATIFGVLLMALLFGWVFSYFYLSQGLKADTSNKSALNFKTEPADPVNLVAPVTVTFDASEIKVDLTKYTILSYNWNFGDKDQGTGQTVKHTYKSKGTGEYEVVLILKALEKNTKKPVQQEFKRIISIQNEKVLAEFTVDKEKGPIPLKVTLDASLSKDPDGEITTYEWDLDDDNEFDDGKEKIITYEFTQIGKYKVRLRVVDNNNESAIAEKTIEAESAEKIDAVITVEDDLTTLETYKEYSFNGEKSSSKFGLVIKYTWDFSDKTAAKNGRIVTHTYENPGTYSIQLKVEDEEGNIGTENKEIIVKKAAAKPTAIINSDPQEAKGVISGNMPLTVNFDAKKSTDPDNDIVEYNWDFNGDGKFDKTGENIKYVFETIGNFKVTLAVKDSKGNSDSAEVNVKVFSRGLEAKVLADPVEGYVPLKVKFDASSSAYPDAKIVSYEWNFGDETPKILGDAKIEHEFNRIGTFTTELTAIASDGTRNTDKIVVNVRPVPLQACFETNNIKGAAPLIVTFDPMCSTGTITEYKWSFGYDDLVSRQRKPTHTYQTPGTYEAVLEVRDDKQNLSTYKSTIVVTGEITQ